jgi:SAM-dependent methyltransferase
MADLTDRNDLLTSQYRDPSNLNARVRLHERFSTNPLGWHPWVFEHLDISARSRLLEVGCGPGYLWRRNLKRIPLTWRVLLTDFSIGMTETAFRHLHKRARFQFATLDVQAIALPSEHFDAVIANHMLHHVPALDQALAEIWRVLKPGGRFLATTNGRRHLQELRDFVLRCQAGEEAAIPREVTGGQVVENFTLENGPDRMSPWFSEIDLKRYDDALVVTEVEPIIAFVKSSSLLRVEPENLAAFRDFLAGRMDAEGAIRFTKDSGLFSAIRR